MIRELDRAAAVPVLALPLGAVLLVALILAAPVAAETSYTVNGRPVCTGALAELFNKSLIERIKASWAALDSEIRDCVGRRTGASTAQLVGQCVSASDPGVMPHIQSCQQAAEAARRTREARARAEARRRALVDRYGESVADSILAGRLLNSMTAEQVVETLGQPMRKDRIPPNFELWIYHNKRVALRDGQVTHFEP